MDMDFLKPIIAGQIRHAMTVAAGSLVTVGAIHSDQTGAFTEIASGMAMWLVVAIWSWWKTSGQAQVLAALKHVTDRHTQEGAVAAATAAPAGAAVTGVLAALVAVGLAVALLMPSGAYAQDKPKRLIQLPSFGQGSNEASAPATATADNGSKLANILAKPFNDLADFINSDAAAAAALAVAVPELQDGHGQQCWMEMGTFTALLRAHPIPISLKAMTDFEALRLAGMAANRLCVNVHCTQVFADAGAMAQAASPVPLLIPSLHDLCSKIPQIAVVPPVAAPAAPAPANP